MDKDELIKQVSTCEKCALFEGRTNVVPGDGSWEAEVMFIGEGPGKDEDIQGKPFVGASGKFLTQLIESIGLTREDVFITNVVKCRPPENRDPFPEEISSCWAYLVRQIKEIKPLVIVTLGRHSMARFCLMQKFLKNMGSLRFTKAFGLMNKFTSLFIILRLPCMIRGRDKFCWMISKLFRKLLKK